MSISSSGNSVYPGSSIYIRFPNRQSANISVTGTSITEIIPHYSLLQVFQICQLHLLSLFRSLKNHQRLFVIYFFKSDIIVVSVFAMLATFNRRFGDPVECLSTSVAAIPLSYYNIYTDTLETVILKVREIEYLHFYNCPMF